jgi:hypothetical protein
MLSIRRFAPALLFVALAASCTTPRIEAMRVTRPDVQVLPGANGYLNPLTGVVSYTPPAWESRPVLAVKIGNSSPERPQAGLDRADVVYEELVEGGETRFLAFFLTNSPDRLGPIRSCRTVDPTILAPIGGLFGYSGGVAFVVQAVRAVQNVKDVGADVRDSAYYRDSARSMPYNLYTSASKLLSGQQGSPPARPQFDFLSSADDITKGGLSGKTANFTFESGNSSVRYGYDSATKTYLRFIGSNSHATQSGTQVSFRNVLLQTVSVSAGSYSDHAGNITHNINLIGSGRAILLRGGRAFVGTWSRSSKNDPTRFVDSSGNVLRLAPGRTIVELLPDGQQVSYS